ncbi:MAG: radical SAM protein [Acidobacteriia bacterium]|nr:radical SAM protein [Terriglobia bacterium]
MKVLILTGGLVTGTEASVWSSLRKLFRQWRASEHAWLDLKIKLVFAEFLIRKPRPQGADLWAPDLAEVVLATLLNQAGVEYKLATYCEAFDQPRLIEQLLAETDCVFLSTTFLRDLSEILPLIQMVKRRHNHLVLGGPLASLLAERWEGMREVEVLAAGYGEFLVPSLVDWMRSGFKELRPPSGGRLVQRGSTRVLYSGVPATNTLDFLPTPDWSLSERDRKTRYRMIYYESVRGCPYRCNFCNYPYLFTDTRFRYKSAERMVEEWEKYLTHLNIEFITCLDSLFTVPRPRLVTFCRSLLKRRLSVKWICYARADDLADERTTALMKAAGVHQVQIGIESGDQGQLDNMDKACTVESNGRALDNCRKYGITSVVSLIVGFPGESAGTLARTLEFLRQHPPDFFFLAPFSTRATGVPLLTEANRHRFDLHTADHLKTGAPYWRHRTMSCAEVGNHVRELHRSIMGEGISLHAALFHDRLLSYRAEERGALLRRQQALARGSPVTSWIFDGLNRFVDWQLAADVERCVDRSVPAELPQLTQLR